MSASAVVKPRYGQLDALRGMAILGILLLNIVSFGLPQSAYLNPAWNGLPNVADQLDWLVIELFAARKFLSLFALLFGAGLVFQRQRGGRWLNCRLSLLVGLGLLHYFGFWQGDILFAYGCVGLIVWRFIDQQPDTQTCIRRGISLYLLGCGLLLLYGLLSLGGPETASDWQPTTLEIIQEQQRQFNAVSTNMRDRALQLPYLLIALVTQYGWQLAGLMLIGAGLIGNGWLLGQRSNSYYLGCAVRLLIPGFLLNALGAISQWQLGWSYRWSHLLLQVPGELAAPLQTLGYIALVQASWQKISHWRLILCLQQVGRMALSNYLLQTLLAVTVFSYLGGFMQFSRWQLTLLVPLFWLVNLLFSRCWLTYYVQGPVEKVWRRLTQRLAEKN